MQPFQCSMMVLHCVLQPPELSVVWPTAQASLGELADTPSRFPVGEWAAAFRQVVPFQCRMTPWRGLVMVPPTAQALLAEVAVTALRSMSAPTKAGTGTTFQDLPSQCSIRALKSLVPLPVQPTAQASLGETTATRSSAPAGAGVGLGTVVHAVPFQCSIRVLSDGPVPAPGPPPTRPTAQASVADAAATPLRKPPPPGFGLAWRVQVLPSQW